MKRSLLSRTVIVANLLVWTGAAHAHGIAGNRYFDGTMTFDDPAVADEAIVPDFSYLGYPTQGNNVTENRINWSFARLLTPTIALTLDSGWLHQNWPIGHTSGFDKTNLGLKYEAYRDNKHEALVSVSLAWGIAHSGSIGVAADAPNTIQPGITFGKGFGDFPTRCPGCGRSRSPARLWKKNPSATEGGRLFPIPLRMRLTMSLRRPFERCIGVSLSNTARSI
jgi:hypothetical protein